MKHEVIIKELPECTVYYKRGNIKNFSEMTDFIMGSAEECLATNPNLKCTKPDYCYVSYLDKEFNSNSMNIEYAQAVEAAGKETENIKFKILPKQKAVTVLHKGSYNEIPDAYALAMQYIKEHGYKMADSPRERYIDGIWNTKNEDDWLTEIEIPVI